jgi:CheY-specific phosphatase CheX
MANTTWGELGWSAGTFGGANDATVSVTGQSLTSALNFVSISLSPIINLTGEQLTSSLNNNVSFSITGSVDLTTNLANLTLNSVSAFPIIFAPVTAPGTPTTWGSGSYGSGSWGENIGLELSEGNLTIDVITPVNVIGQQLTTSLNSVSFTIDGSVALTGQQLTLSLGEETVTAEANAFLTGQQLTLSEGTVDPAPDAEVTGIQLTTTLDSVDIDIAVAALVTGQQLTTSLNSVNIDLNTPVNLTTNLATLSLNSVATKLDVAVNVTGFRLTGTTAQIYVSAWTPVNTGQSVNWTEVAA